MNENLEPSPATSAEEQALTKFNTGMSEVLLEDGIIPTKKDMGTLDELRTGRLASGGQIIRVEEPYVTAEDLPAADDGSDKLI